MSDGEAVSHGQMSGIFCGYILEMSDGDMGSTLDGIVKGAGLGWLEGGVSNGAGLGYLVGC